MLLGLEREKGTLSHGCRWLLETGKGQGMGSLLEHPKETQPCRQLNFSPVRPILDY